MRDVCVCVCVCVGIQYTCYRRRAHQLRCGTTAICVVQREAADKARRVRVVVVDDVVCRCESYRAIK